MAPEFSPRRNLARRASRNGSNREAFSTVFPDEGDWEEDLERALAGERPFAPRRNRPAARDHIPSGTKARPPAQHHRAPASGRRSSWRTRRKSARAQKRHRKLVRAQRRTFWGRHPRVSGALVVLLLFGPVWISLGGALADPTLGSSASARVAEWSRDHGVGGLVTWLENLYYSHHPPPVGGQPSRNALPGHAHETLPTGSGTKTGALATPASLVPFPATPLPGEGKWTPAGRLVDGVPAVYTTFMRPDAVHTSVVDGVAWMDTNLLAAKLYSGSYIPGGGPYRYNTPLSAKAGWSLVAAFNGGFRLGDSQAGYFTNGVMVKPLVAGAASFVIYSNGMATVGAWGSEVKMTPKVVAVRQELRLLVDNGRAAPGLATNEASQWGNVIGNSLYVARSGVGVTRNGALVYVGGPDLDAVDLARLLVRAGALRAMELDINPAWVNFATFATSAHGLATLANAQDLLPSADMSGAYRYFVSYWERDFFTLSARTQLIRGAG